MNTLTIPAVGTIIDAVRVEVRLKNGVPVETPVAVKVRVEGGKVINGVAYNHGTIVEAERPALVGFAYVGPVV